jgi:hypothetical protein
MHTENIGPVIAPGQIKDYTGGVLSRSRAYELLKAGVLRAKKLGRRTGIVRASVDAYLAALPDFAPSTPPAPREGTP